MAGHAEQVDAASAVFDDECYVQARQRDRTIAGADPMSEPAQLTLDTDNTSDAVLHGEPDDQGDKFVGQRRTPADRGWVHFLT
ncbi:hypothetical protein ABH920_007293 [Catenulispora sp. EB89]|uniref:hypothetical protein n=1 Tax=Catenulispora sp. EB89 TaxID=3156257 RepID=UPI003519457F